MSASNSQPKAKSVKAENADEADAPKILSFKEFLESVPPGQACWISDFHTTRQSYNSSVHEFGGKRLWLHCNSESCKGERYFDPIGDRPYVSFGEVQSLFLEYRCSNCESEEKRYSLLVFAKNHGAPAQVCKYGEIPSFGPPISNRLLRLLDEDGDKELFLKGRQCENQGLGVGAFSYYRRVVENKKVALIQEIRKVAETVNAAQEAKDALDAALTEKSFKESLEKIKGAIPESLLINGHNPMVLLYSALSDGLHDRNDDHCLELATSIRVVLSDLVLKVSEARKENAELQKALTKLVIKPKRGDEVKGK